MGVWAAYDPSLQVIILDTEGKSNEEEHILYRKLIAIKLFNLIDQRMKSIL